MWHPDTPIEYRNQIVTGDARDLARAVPDASIDLIFTDPIYSERSLYDWLAQEAQRVLRPNGVVLCWSNGHWHRKNADWLEAGGLTYRWDFAVINGDTSAPMDGKIISKTNRLLWFDAGRQSKMRGYLADGYLSVGGRWPIPRADFGWGKSAAFTIQAVDAFSVQDDVLLDPFAGGGTHLCIARLTLRNFIAYEVDPERAQRARARVEQTQAMHPVLLGQQEVMELI